MLKDPEIGPLENPYRSRGPKWGATLLDIGTVTPLGGG